MKITQFINALALTAIFSAMSLAEIALAQNSSTEDISKLDKVAQDDGINQKYWSLLNVKAFTAGIAKANPAFEDFNYATVLFNDDFIMMNVFKRGATCQSLDCPVTMEPVSIRLPVVQKISEGCYDLHVAQSLPLSNASGKVEKILVERFASERCDAKLQTRQGKAQYIIQVPTKMGLLNLGILFDLVEVKEIVPATNPQ